MLKLFQSLSQEAKINFFVKCQEILIKYHQNSDFVVRRDNLKQILDKCAENINQYKGFVYETPEICLLWNYIYIADPKNVNQALKDNAYKEPNPAFNAISIDFAVFDSIANCLTFVKEANNDNIKHILFIREGKPKIYPKDKLIKTLPINLIY